MATKIKTWFCSDLHFSHPSILYFKPKRRELAGITLEELQEDKESALKKHDEWLIDKWNKTIAKCDVVYILGDFCLGNRERTEKILQRLHGRKFLIIGNHDKSCRGLERYFEWTGNIKEAKFTNTMYDFIDKNETFAVEMCHFPMIAWNRRPHGTCHLHGHTHGNLDEFNKNSEELRLDIGFDGGLSNYNFIGLEELYEKYKEIARTTDSSTFVEHVEKIMEKIGFRA